MNVADELHAAVDETGLARDQYGRSAVDCAAGAAFARDAADELRTIVRLVRDGAIVLGRLGGDRQGHRLETSAALFDRVSARDTVFADGLKQAQLQKHAQ